MTELMTAKETAAYLRTSLQQVRRMIREGDLFAVRWAGSIASPCPPWWSSWRSGKNPDDRVSVSTLFLLSCAQEMLHHIISYFCC